MKANKIFLFSGHMIDRSDRPVPRFPARDAALAGRLIGMKLDEWRAAKGDLAICSGACGGDILFAEACLARGLGVQLHLPLPDPEFIEASVAFAGAPWVERYRKLRSHPSVSTLFLPAGYRNQAELNVFARNNLHMLEAATNPGSNLQFMALWNGEAGDGEGGTRHMVDSVRQAKGSVYILNPKTMKLLERLKAPGPKRILALDGGGIRGAITLGYLEKIEDMLRKRHGNDPDFRLCDYFDLIGGTSTGAIIASALATGWSAQDIKKLYLDIGGKIFAKKWKAYLPWHTGKYLKARFGAEPLKEKLEEVFGDMTLGDERVRTGLCIVAKRADTQSTWPLINHPEGRYYRHNAPILLRNAVRASTAAPTYFIPELFDVGFGQEGAFVDGGVSMANNPALQLFLVATLKGFPFHWPTGAGKLLIVSVGTGMSRPKLIPAEVADDKLWNWAVNIPDMLMQDASWLNQTLLQYMSDSPTSWKIDGEIGDLRGDLLAPAPLLSYLRYNVFIERDELEDLGLGDLAVKPGIKSLQEMSEAANRDHLALIGEKAAAVQIEPAHFPDAFNLPAKR
jgi:uncharacterized protein